ncbi:aspartyl/asparaginyl beta-hydroxylase domain-containing protein [Sphingomonas sp. PAMC 26617]|uniref:aspartyl/asparaginyl beta-hydroxylase domain-containing protein n=1 Tax=Sphingomonas sp. PAMC 26617 TaxID=1112216 RepID=UPI000289BD68|nr:aspartyl/asparaginyl beta-hydroxylase domain-containing protein [Sphingomonas sp. PAMC 26617]
MIDPAGAVGPLLREAAALRQRGDAAGERTTLDRAIALDPARPEAHNARGMRALADADFGAAVACFGRAIALDPGEPALRLNLAAAHRAAGDADGERAALQSVLDIDQLHFLAQLRMAELLQRQGLVSDAARHWSAVVQLAAQVAERPPALVEAERRALGFLEAHNAAFADALLDEFGGAPRLQAASRRFQACADHTLGRRRIYQNQCAGVHFPFLPADEFFDSAHFPWFAALEAATPAIRAEALAMVAGGADAIRPYVRLDAGTPATPWSRLDGSTDWSACFLWEYGQRNDAVCDRCPATAAALAAVPQTQLPGKAPSAFFSILRGGATIPPHTGVTNTRAIIHLPLVVPEGCGFRVGGETRAWREGEAFGFDDTIEHEAWNRSDQIRIVLIFDVWNPYLTPDEQADLARLFAVTDRGLVAPRA